MRNVLMPLLFVVFTFPTAAYAQQQSTLLVLTNKKATVYLDGEAQGIANPNIPYKVVTQEGEHYAQVQFADNGAVLDKGETVNAEPGKQKVIKLMFDEPGVGETMERISIADINFNLPGTVTVLSWQSNNANRTYPYPEFYYAFDAGDEISVDVSMSNKNGTNVINILTYPDGVVRYTNNSFGELKDLKIKIPKRAIYKFVLATNHAFDRNCFLKVNRKPASKASIDFNTKVMLKTNYTPVSIQQPQDFFINGGTTATFSTGKSRVIIPVSLPVNTVEWYYRFSASRDKADIENVKHNFGLFSEITTMVFGLTGAGAAISKAIFDKLAQPPGADFCHIYMLTPESHTTFLAKADDQWKYYPEGSRENFKSGNVRINCCNSGQYYLGIKNPSSAHGINISVEVVAITAKEEYVMEGDGN